MLINEKRDMCAYLIEHEKDDCFDEVTYCPRMLCSDDKHQLLYYMCQCVFQYAEDLEGFMSAHSDIDYSPYFDRFYHRVMSSIRSASGALHLRYSEDSF